MTSSSRLIQKDPISEDPSDLDNQIRGLEEEKGIFHHEEVVSPPTLEETDEDSYAQPPDPEDMERRASTSKSVRFSARSNDSTDLSADNQALVKRLEYPHVPLPQEEEDLPPPGSTHPGYPPSSPPAYTPSENQRDVNSPEPRSNRSNTGSGSMYDHAIEQEDLEQLRTVDSDEFDEMVAEDEARRLARLRQPGAFTAEESAALRMVVDYKHEEFEVEPQFRPFQLEYIPSIGDIDAFIKVPRPDEVDDNIGYTELDEPAPLQSDAAIVGLQIRNATKETAGPSEAPVKKLDRADKNKDEIDNWIKNVRDLHRTRPSPSVVYKSQMPDIERLMQEWPEEFQDKLRELKFPTAELDCSLEEYADICLSLLDIPKGKSRIQALHLMFSLYMEFKKSQHFGNIAQNNQQTSDSFETTDRLEL